MSLKLRQMMIGAPLKRLRERAELSQAELAGALQYSTAQFISNWERGVSLPPVIALKPMAEAYGIPAKSLIDLVFRYKQNELDEERKAALAGAGVKPTRRKN